MPTAELPQVIRDEEELDELLSRPDERLVEALASLEGNILVLGVSGKMGPSLARLARRALDQVDRRRRVIGVARFPSPESRNLLERWGVETIPCDLLDPNQVDVLPDAKNVVFLVGRKFGSVGNEPLTWAVNTCCPALIARKYRASRIVALSTGNVYPFVPVRSDGCREEDSPAPVGEYAQSCLGRERVFQYYSTLYGTPDVLIRINYAVDLRYGVLVDIARKVFEGSAVNLATGWANVIWQGDANRAILWSLTRCATPPSVLNVTGEKVSVRRVAGEFGRFFGKTPLLEGTESETALISNAGKLRELLGPLEVSTADMVRWVTHWIRTGGRLLDKPTHFEERQGKF